MITLLILAYTLLKIKLFHTAGGIKMTPFIEHNINPLHIYCRLKYIDNPLPIPYT